MSRCALLLVLCCAGASASAVLPVGRGPTFQYSYSPRSALGLDPYADYQNVRYNREPPNNFNCSFIIPSGTADLSQGTVTYVLRPDPGFVIQDVFAYQKATLYTPGSIIGEFSTDNGVTFTRFFYTPAYGPELTHERGATLRSLFSTNLIIRYTLVLTNGFNFNIQFLRDCDDATTALRFQGTIISEAQARRTVVLIPPTAVWSVLDNGSDQQTAWRLPQFDDQAWNTGPAELGYGDGDEATTVSYGTSATAKHITTYFRHWFMAPVQRFERLTLGVLRDDGAVVYLDGAQIASSNIQLPVDYTTPALNADDETRFYELAINPQLLTVPGPHLMAAEVHQQSASSSDLSFALDLRGLLRQPRLHAALSNNCVVLSWTEPGWHLQTANDLDGPWAAIPNPTSNPYTTCNLSTRAFFRLEKDP